MFEIKKSVRRDEMIGLGYKELGCMFSSPELRRLEELARGNHIDLVCHQLTESAFMVYRKEKERKQEYIVKTRNGIVLKPV